MPRFLLLGLLLLPTIAIAQDDDQTPTDPRDALMQARATYNDGNYAACARSYAAAIDLGVVNDGVTYNAACCFALAGDTDAAFAYLQQSLDAGWRDAEHMQRDTDLASLRDDLRWSEAVADAEANFAAYAATVNAELMEMYTADQAERFAAMEGEVEWRTVAENDAARRARAYEMIEAGELEAAADYFHAAMILQHGQTSDDYALARDLAEQAIALDQSHGLARWLTAAATGRYLWSIDEPQIYGTQSTLGDDGLLTMEPIDEDAVTDAERAAKGVPTLEQAYARLAQQNTERQAAMGGAPDSVPAKPGEEESDER